MAGRNVDTEALEAAANALGKYIEEVEGSIQKMRDAAQDCSDNMGSDVYSQHAISDLESCATELSKTIKDAQTLQKRILQQKRQIEDSTPNWN